MENWRVSLARILYDCSNKRYCCCCRENISTGHGDFAWKQRQYPIFFFFSFSCLWYEKEFLLLTSTLENEEEWVIWRRRESNGMWKNWESAGGLKVARCEEHFSYFSLLNGGDRDSLTWNYFIKSIKSWNKYFKSIKFNQVIL